MGMLDGFIGADEKNTEPMSKKDAASAAKKLKELYAIYTKKHVFKPGDLVTWKPGMKIDRLPRYGEPMIVLEIFEEPIRNTNNHGSNQFMRPADMRCARIASEDGQFNAWVFNSAEMQPYDGK